jgi:hypothetical protein
MGDGLNVLNSLKTIYGAERSFRSLLSLPGLRSADRLDLSAAEFTARAKELCETVLPFSIGIRYPNVVLRRLEGEESTNSLEGLYWAIVESLMELEV